MWTLIETAQLLRYSRIFSGFKICRAQKIVRLGGNRRIGRGAEQRGNRPGRLALPEILQTQVELTGGTLAATHGYADKGQKDGLPGGARRSARNTPAIPTEYRVRPSRRKHCQIPKSQTNFCISSTVR